MWDASLRIGRRFEDHPSTETVHRLRVRVKRLRYTLESLQAVGGKRVCRALERLETLQDLLGAHHDAVTQSAWLRSYAETTDLPVATLLATGGLLQLLERRARRSLSRAGKLWAKFEDRAVRRKTLAELSS